MFISIYVVKSPPLTPQTRLSGRRRHIVKFTTYRIRLSPGSCLRPRKAVRRRRQAHESQVRDQELVWEAARPLAADLVFPAQPSAEPMTGVSVDGSIRLAHRAEMEVIPPAQQQAVEPPHHVLGGHFFRQFVKPPLPTLFLDPGERLTIHTRCAARSAAQRLGVAQHVPPVDLVVQEIETDPRLPPSLSHVVPCEAPRPFSAWPDAIRQSPRRSLLPAPFPDQGSFPPPALPGFIGTTTLSATPGGRFRASRHHRWPAPPASHPKGLPVLHTTPLSHMPSPLPRRNRWVLYVVRFPQRRRPSPKFGRVGFRIALFEACSAFTARYGLRACQVSYGPSTPEASTDSLPPRPFRLLPAGTTFAGSDSHPLRSCTFCTAH